MEKEKFQELVEVDLLPFFSGANLRAAAIDSTGREATVAFIDICSIKLKSQKSDNYCVVIERSQKFAAKNSDYVTEFDVVDSFVTIIDEIKSAIGEPFETDLLRMIKRRIVVKAICQDLGGDQAVLAVVDCFDDWSTRLYEGQPISAAVGLEPNSGGRRGEIFSDLWNEDFSSVISNGIDTLVVGDYDGYATEYLPLPPSTNYPPFSPMRLAAIAEWTAQNTDRIAIILNRRSELLLLRNGQLVFTRRGGVWHFLAYEPLVKQMKIPQNTDVREAVLSSCLDASYARTGACIGILRSRHKRMLSQVANKSADRLLEKSSTKARFLTKAFTGLKFQGLDRRIRQELLAIDGATILDHDGDILTVGAILKLEGGSSEGGRKAAAEELSNYGTGIKISQDGGIEAYYRSNPKETIQVAFSMMK